MRNGGILLLLISSVIFLGATDATKIIYQDNTHLYNLICCNDTDCITLRDVSYISNNSVYEFNTAEISGLKTCYEAGNKYDINISDWTLSNPKTVVVLIFGIVVILVIIAAVFKAVRR